MTSSQPLSGLELPPLSLYVHIPWCVRKCPYCDFNSHKAEEKIPEQAYVDALIADLKEEQQFAQGRRLQSIFMGGGTPSLFSPSAIDQILRSAEELIGFNPNIEITMEANPGTFEQEKFRGFHDAGVNRLSIGIQSFNEQQLQRLGRIHGRKEALGAIHMAREAGFTNINLDLMHGLPEQSPEDAERDLQQAISLEPEHISWYQLTIEPNTEYYSRPPTLPVEDELADIQQLGEELLANAGYEQYEISAYARKGSINLQSRHNLNYWRFGDYLGIGAGAHGKITDIQTQQLLRRRKTRLPNHYLDTKKAFCSETSVLTAEDLPLEFTMNVLRLSEGAELESFKKRCGLPLQHLEPQLSQLKEKGLLANDLQRLKTTPKGQRFLNMVLAEFM